MKKGLFLVLFLSFSTLSCLAQQTKEDFLNEVRPKLVDFRFRKLYMNPKAEGIWNNFHDKKEVPGLFQTIIPQTELRELYERAKDTIIENWNCNRLIWAKCTTSEPKRRRLTLLHKTAKQCWVFISKPAFSDNGEWAIISVNVYSSSPRAFSYGYIMAFKKERDRWKRVDWQILRIT